MHADPEVHARADRRLILVSGVLLLLAACVAWARELDPPWRASQARARAALAEVSEPPAGAEVPDGIRQIWIEKLGRVDRCVTCHVAVEWGEAFREAPEPVRSHPFPELLAKHPVERFGCTLCHGGQGSATTVEAAHGHDPHWEEPLLDTALAERYGIQRAELMEYRCAICHRTADEVKGMSFLTSAYDVVFDVECTNCHVVPTLPRGGKPTAPDLSHEGDKHPTKFAFPQEWDGPRTALAWHVAHLVDPERTTPGSAMAAEMKKARLEPKQATALALLVMSWRRDVLPPAWLPPREAPGDE